LPYRDVRAFGGFDSRQDAVGRGFDFHDGFIGFDFEKRFALGDAVAFLLPPSDELAGFLRHLESGHYYAEGHSRSIGEGLDDGLQPLNSNLLRLGAGFDHVENVLAGGSFTFACGRQRAVHREIVSPCHQ